MESMQLLLLEYRAAFHGIHTPSPILTSWGQLGETISKCLILSIRLSMLDNLSNFGMFEKANIVSFHAYIKVRYILAQYLINYIV